MTADPRPPIDHPFLAADGVPLEIVFQAPPEPKRLLVIWPCTTGNVLGPLYAVPRDFFLQTGTALLLYNPRGHGNSRGTYSLQAVDDLELWFRREGRDYEHLPRYAVGHSGASFGLPLVADRIPFAHFFFASPILNAHESARYMYDHGHEKLWLRLFLSGDGEADELLKKLFHDQRWLDRTYWKKNNLRKRYDFPLWGKSGYIESMGIFLENIFHSDLESMSGLKRHRAITTIFLPHEDVWYPVENTKRVAEGLGIPVVKIPGAREHFFIGAWDNVWQFVHSAIDKEPAAA